MKIKSLVQLVLKQIFLLISGIECPKIRFRVHIRIHYLSTPAKAHWAGLYSTNISFYIYKWE